MTLYDGYNVKRKINSNAFITSQLSKNKEFQEFVHDWFYQNRGFIHERNIKIKSSEVISGRNNQLYQYFKQEFLAKKRIDNLQARKNNLPNRVFAKQDAAATKKKVSELYYYPSYKPEDENLSDRIDRIFRTDDEKRELDKIIELNNAKIQKEAISLMSNVAAFLSDSVENKKRSDGNKIKNSNYPNNTKAKMEYIQKTMYNNGRSMLNINNISGQRISQNNYVGDDKKDVKGVNGNSNLFITNIEDSDTSKNSSYKIPTVNNVVRNEISGQRISQNNYIADNRNHVDGLIKKVNDDLKYLNKSKQYFRRLVDVSKIGNKWIWR